MFNDLKNWFSHSETIFWARLQVAAGIIWTVVSVADMSPLLSPKWFAVWGIVNGIIAEILRRRNTETMNTMVPDQLSEDLDNPKMVKVTTLLTKPITSV